MNFEGQVYQLNHDLLIICNMHTEVLSKIVSESPLLLVKVIIGILAILTQLVAGSIIVTHIKYTVVLLLVLISCGTITSTQRHF